VDADERAFIAIAPPNRALAWTTDGGPAIWRLVAFIWAGEGNSCIRCWSRRYPSSKALSVV
jgi:hypothetical protein